MEEDYSVAIWRMLMLGVGGGGCISSSACVCCCGGGLTLINGVVSLSPCSPRCSNHGQCRVTGEAQWECRCYEGWDGPDCGVPLEQNCADNKDNDKGTEQTHFLVICKLILFIEFV